MLHIFHCWYIIILSAYSAAVRIPVFTSAETASPEFIEERLPLFCTFHLLDVELSPNGARAVGATLNDRLKAALAHVGGGSQDLRMGLNVHGERVESEPITGDLDAESPAGSRGRAPGGGQGRSPLKLKSFGLFHIQTSG
jgi:hypothetical protein